jgi:hypothetical protein
MIPHPPGRPGYMRIKPKYMGFQILENILVLRSASIYGLFWHKRIKLISTQLGFLIITECINGNSFLIS